MDSSRKSLNSSLSVCLLMAVSLLIMISHGFSICLFSITDLALSSPHLRSLLPPQCDLRCHDALPLHHQQAAGTSTVPPAAEAFVAFQTRNDTVVPTACTFGAPGHLAWFLLMPLWRQGHFILSSVPAADALPRASVRTCHVNNFLGF